MVLLIVLWVLLSNILNKTSILFVQLSNISLYIKYAY